MSSKSMHSSATFTHKFWKSNIQKELNKWAEQPKNIQCEQCLHTMGGSNYTPGNWQRAGSQEEKLKGANIWMSAYYV